MARLQSSEARFFAHGTVSAIAQLRSIEPWLLPAVFLERPAALGLRRRAVRGLLAPAHGNFGLVNGSIGIVESALSPPAMVVLCVQEMLPRGSQVLKRVPHATIIPGDRA